MQRAQTHNDVTHVVDVIKTRSLLALALFTSAAASAGAAASSETRAFQDVGGLEANRVHLADPQQEQVLP